MTQEESHPDQEGRAHNRRRCQSGQVAEQGAPLSRRPTGLPARTTVTSLPTLIRVTADEHWVICRGPTYALLLIAIGRRAAPSPLRPGPCRAAGSGRPVAPAAGLQAAHPGAGPGRGLVRPGPAGPAPRVDRVNQSRRRWPAWAGPAGWDAGRAGRGLSGRTTPSCPGQPPAARLTGTAPRGPHRRGRIPDVAGESGQARHSPRPVPAGHRPVPGGGGAARTGRVSRPPGEAARTGPRRGRSGQRGGHPGPGPASALGRAPGSRTQGPATTREKAAATRDVPR